MITKSLAFLSVDMHLYISPAASSPVTLAGGSAAGFWSVLETAGHSVSLWQLYFHLKMAKPLRPKCPAAAERV